jgi:hypothetical protein
MKRSALTGLTIGRLTGSGRKIFSFARLRGRTKQINLGRMTERDRKTPGRIAQYFTPAAGLRRKNVNRVLSMLRASERHLRPMRGSQRFDIRIKTRTAKQREASRRNLAKARSARSRRRR